jgi:hypothetical protein
MRDPIKIPKLQKVNTYFYKSDVGNVVERYVEDDDGNELFLDRTFIDLPLTRKEKS